MSGDSTEKTVHLRDADAIRSLAHPARRGVINLLYLDGAPRTSTELSRLTGLTPSAMSYHLRSLEKAGIVERADAEGGDSRTRPWRAAGTSIQIHGGEEPGIWEAQDALSDLAIEALRRRLRAIHHDADAEDDAESYIAMSEHTRWLTKEEAGILSAAIGRASEALTAAGWRNEPGPGRRLTTLLYSLLPDVPENIAAEDVAPPADDPA